MPGSLLVDVVVDAADPGRLAHWWARALSWRVDHADDHVVGVHPPEGEPGLPLVFVPVDEAKTAPNRIHLDLDSSSPADQRETVGFLLDLGARPVDLGQGEVPWVVLADPEGNEFCVLDPRPEYEGTGRVAAVVVSALDPLALAGFWAPVSGWSPVSSSSEVASLRHGADGPFLEFVRTARPHTVKNRWYLDVRATSGGWGQDRAVAAALASGAQLADVGQGERASWTVLTDPEGNEFCVLPGSV